MVSFTFCKVNKFFLFHQDDLALFFFFFFFLIFIFIILCSQTAVLLPYKGRFVYMYKKRGKGHHELHLYKNQAVVTHHAKTQMATKVEL